MLKNLKKYLNLIDQLDKKVSLLEWNLLAEKSKIIRDNLQNYIELDIDNNKFYVNYIVNIPSRNDIEIKLHLEDILEESAVAVAIAEDAYEDALKRYENLS